MIILKIQNVLLSALKAHFPYHLLLTINIYQLTCNQ